MKLKLAMDSILWLVIEMIPICARYPIRNGTTWQGLGGDGLDELAIDGDVP